MRKLTSKDLITIGIFNAVAIVLYLFVGVITMPVPILHSFASQPIAALLNGAVFMLLAQKTGKRGMFFISGILHGIVFSMLMGLYATLILAPAAGLLADIICGDFKSKWRTVISYTLLMLGLYYGQVFFFFFFTDWFMSFFEGNALAHKQSAAERMTGMVFLVTTAAMLATGIIGGYIGTRVFKKHFEKAGVAG
ncbi:energy-coupling factor transport system substrate-specific component [Anaerobacterium chartisolvens]|uniref:Energy-coupling factor transport system substrate-specific component n=1 Tax=Anaerobacterium chartisolvens TaxID=1297424 RepID=A0A369BBD5_9FIRM|nr:MptD family putative ECF transporter S component [Anaerobacterium chartisolvens]RCX18840.1 energy-coupling factor transport system substrate-specific component [Anaerobacterium chartisolvens]